MNRVVRGGGPATPGAGRLSLILETLQSSIWFLPSLLAIGAVLAFFVSIYADVNFLPAMKGTSIWLFSGQADAIRDLLATIATSLIAIVSIAFSITIIAVQQAANQYSPQVVGTFTSDKGSQFVLGMYLATFIYVLLVLRQVGGPHADFIPVLSVGLSILLDLFCLGLLIFFIHRMVTLLRVSGIIQRIHRELTEEIDFLYPEEGARGEREPAPLEEIVKGLPVSRTKFHLRSERAGFLSRLDTDKLAKVKHPGVRWVYIPIKIGDFIPRGQVLAEIDNYEGGDARFNATLRAAFIIGDRTMESDPMYGIRQLLDISLRALSPAVNTPTNAEFSLYYMGDALNRLAAKRFPECLITFPKNPIKYIVTTPTWREYVQFSFDQLRASFRNEVRITSLTVDILGRIADSIVSGERVTPLLDELAEIRTAVKRGQFVEEEKAMLFSQIDQTRRRIMHAAEGFTSKSD